MEMRSAMLAALKADETRTGLSKEALKQGFLDNLLYTQGKFPALATRMDYYLALARLVRDHLLQRWISTAESYTRERSRTVAYFSAEFLLGPQLDNNLVNLGIRDAIKAAIAELGLDLDELVALSRNPDLATAAWGALPRAFSTRWRLSRSRPSAMASATNSAFSSST